MTKRTRDETDAHEWRERTRYFIDGLPGADDLAKFRAGLLLLLSNGGKRLTPGIVCQAVALSGLAQRPASVTVRQAAGSAEIYDAHRGHLRAGADGKIERAEFAKAN